MASSALEARGGRGELVVGDVGRRAQLKLGANVFAVDVDADAPRNRPIASRSRRRRRTAL
jgi:hypothetical protein